MFTVDPQRARSFVNAVASLAPRIVILTISPYHPSYEETLRVTDQGRRLLAELCTLPNVRFVDIETRHYPYALFLDTSHLNCDGAKRYTAELRTELQWCGLIPTP